MGLSSVMEFHIRHIQYSGGPLIEPPDYRTNPVIEPKWLYRVSAPRSEGGGTRCCFFGGYLISVRAQPGSISGPALYTRV